MEPVTTISPVTQDTTGTETQTPDDDRRPVQARIAGAPISWGVCEVPGWGYQLEPAAVLEQMRELGLAATEFGPDGFLETAPSAKADQLASYGLKAVGGFLPVLLHDPGHDPLPEVEPLHRQLRRLRCRGRGAGGVHRRRRVRRPPGARRRRLDHPAGQPRPDRRPRRVPGASSPPSTPTSAPWSSRGRRPSGSSPARGSVSASTPDTCWSAAATRSPSPPPTPSASCTSTSRTSTPRWQPGCGPARRPSALRCATGCSARSAGRRRHRGDGPHARGRRLHRLVRAGAGRRARRRRAERCAVRRRASAAWPS